MRFVAAVLMVAIAVGCLISARRLGGTRSRGFATVLPVILLAGLSGALVVSAVRLVAS